MVYLLKVCWKGRSCLLEGVPGRAAEREAGAQQSEEGRGCSNRWRWRLRAGRPQRDQSGFCFDGNVRWKKSKKDG